MEDQMHLVPSLNRKAQADKIAGILPLARLWRLKVLLDRGREGAEKRNRGRGQKTMWTHRQRGPTGPMEHLVVCRH